MEVIEGFKELIAEFRPLILMEILPSYKKSNIFRTERSDKIVSIITDMKYDIYRVIKNIDDSLKEIIKIDVIQVHSDINLCDYIFVPEELSINF